MDIKKELIIGTIGSLIVVGIVFLSLNKFNKIKNNLLINEKNKKSNVIEKPVISEIAILTIKEISKHNNPNDCWIIVNNSVYNVTSYLSIHPGGAKKIISYCGQDATQAFMTKGGKGSHSNSAKKDLLLLKIGDVNQKVNLLEKANNIIKNIDKISFKEREKEEDDEDERKNDDD